MVKVMRKGLFFCLVGGLFSMMGCALKKMPTGDLVSVEYRRSGTMARPEFEGSVERDSTGAFVLKAMKESHGPMFEKRIDTETMKRFCQIIKDEKMYQYKESYKPTMEVLDGWSWSFRAKFDDGSVIASHGNNAGPRGNGLARIRGYMQELIQDGVQVEFLEEEWE